MWLTLNEDNNEIRVNFDNVLSYRRYERDNYTEIVSVVPGNDGRPIRYYVNEEPQTIENLIVEEQRRMR